MAALYCAMFVIVIRIKYTWVAERGGAATSPKIHISCKHRTVILKKIIFVTVSKMIVLSFPKTLDLCGHNT